MSKAGKRVLSVLLWFFGGTLYFLLEVAYKTATGHQERISWTMLVLAVVLCVPVERAGEELPLECPLWLQAAVCAALVTLVEFCAGCVLNLWLGHLGLFRAAAASVRAGMFAVLLGVVGAVFCIYPCF